MRHPARNMEFDALWAGLQVALAEKLVNLNVSSEGLHLYCYSEECVYERLWNPITMLARGIILDPMAKKIVATPFPKFFNVGEANATVPDLPFETFEKLDGSLIILFFHNGFWCTATKGSFTSDQAEWAQVQLCQNDLAVLVSGTTYLLEAIYPENRIVVHYDYQGLVLLGAYDEDGYEQNYEELQTIGKLVNWRVAKRHHYNHVSELLELASTLPSTEEGFVLRFENGLRLKVKGDEYCRIHRLVSRLTPLAMWEAMKNGDDLDALRRDLPEEFWLDFDNIIELLSKQMLGLLQEVTIANEELKHLTDKEVGLRLGEFTDIVRKFIFPFRKQQGNLLIGRSREAVYRYIRPDGNCLDGYKPSSAVNRVQENE